MNTLVFAGGLLPLAQKAEGALSYTVFTANGLPLLQVDDGNTTYALNDHLGSARTLTDDTGSILGGYSYGTLGDDTQTNAEGGISQEDLDSLDDYPFGFQSHLYDEGLAESDFAGRFYFADTGTFDHRDVAGQSVAPYVAMGGDWVNMVDKDGLVFGRFRALTYRGTRAFSGIAHNGDGTYSFRGHTTLRSPGYDPLVGMVGHLPGPAGHTDFAYMQWRQDRDISNMMMTVHSTIGTVRVGGGPEMRLLVELMRNESYAPAHPVNSSVSIAAGNIGGTLAPTWHKEVHTGKTAPVGMLLVPVENVEPLLARLADSLTAKSGPEAEAMPLWAFSSEDHLRGCSVFAHTKAGNLNYSDQVVADIFNSFKATGKLWDSFKLFEQLRESGYLRYYDTPDATERVEIFNENVEELFNNWYFASMGDAPIKGLPDPAVHNAQLGAHTQ